MKPLELVEIALRNSSASGDSVLDPGRGVWLDDRRV